MTNQLRNSIKRELIEDDDFETNKILDKSVHLLRICDEFADDEIDVDEENDRQKERQLEGLRNEIVQWKKLLTDSKEPKSGDGSGNDSLQNIFKDYEKVLSAEQLQYIRSAVDYEKWLAESNEFRKQIAYYLSKRQLIDILRADFEEDAKVRIEAVATTDYVNHFDVNQYPL